MNESQGAMLALETLFDSGLTLHGMRGVERISEPFEYILELHSPLDRQATALQLLGQEVTLRLETPPQPIRSVHGFVAELSQCGEDGRFRYYRARLVPKHARLAANRGFRVYQRMSLAQIIERELGDLNYRIDFHDPLDLLEMVVRYAESSWSFLMRLLERDGRYCYFEHDATNCTLVFADNSYVAVHSPGADDLPLGKQPLGRPHFRTWTVQQSLTPGKARVRDYHPEAPALELQQEATVRPSVTIGKQTVPLDHRVMQGCATLARERFAHRHAGVMQQGVDRLLEEKDRLGRIRMEQQTATAVRSDGESNCTSLAPGKLLRLTDADASSDDYFVTRVAVGIRQAITAEAPELAEPFSCSVEAIPRRLPYRMPRRPNLPRINGVLTAVALGVGEQETATDDLARIRIALRFDQRAEPETCWVRVLQPSAGSGYGAVQLPRQGQEVLVTFVGGDPERPVVLGGVYNARHLPPADAATLRHVHGLWQRSANGGPENASQLTFDTRLGEERVTLYSERAARSVAECRHEIASGSDLTITVGHPVSPPDFRRHSGAGGSTAADDSTVDDSGAADDSSDSESDGGDYELTATQAGESNTGGDQTTTIDHNLTVNTKGQSTWSILEAQFVATPQLTIAAPNSNMIHGYSSRIHAPPIPGLSGQLKTVVGAFELEVCSTPLRCENIRGMDQVNMGAEVDNKVVNMEVSDTWLHSAAQLFASNSFSNETIAMGTASHTKASRTHAIKTRVGANYQT